MYLSPYAQPMEEVFGVIVQFDSSSTHCGAGIVLEQHDARRFREMSGQEVFQP
jgi:hypothetical protein